MMRNANPGLARRFDASNPIVFEDFTDEELLTILADYLKSKEIPATVPAMLTAIEVLAKKRRLPNWGNAGDVHNLVNGAISKCMARVREANPPLAADSTARHLQPEDFISDRCVETLDDIFRPMLGCEGLKQRLRNMERLIARKRKRGLDPMASLDLNFVFSGPPGVG
jgi:Cdc6-like AAA superfamily ATPase